MAVLAVLAAALTQSRLAAQGVTTAAVTGRVTDDAGSPVPQVELTLTLGSTGERRATRSREDGVYSFENVTVGSSFVLAARAIGFEPKTSGVFALALGQRLTLDLSLKRAAVEVAGVTVEANSDPLRSSARTGAQSLLSDLAIHRLPTLNRAFTDFVSTSPQVVRTPGGGNSINGQNDRFNNVQIDGGSNNDLFDLGSTNGVPGGTVNARPLAIEAVREYQILVAPFDVRQGQFTGGLVNAVTKSGTNELHGSAFGYIQNQNFVGKDTAGIRVPVADYQQQQYGFSVGGPIVKDRLHFFASGDFRHDARPFATAIQCSGGCTPADTAGIGITGARFDSVRNILQTKYGFDPGSYAAPTIPNPETNLFGKLSYELGVNSHVEVTGAFVNADQVNLTHRYTAPFNGRDGYQLSNSGYDVTDHTRTVRGKWTAQLSSQLSNELIAAYGSISDVRDPPNRVPLILVAGNSPSTYVAAGAERFSQANSLKQTVIEVTDNLTFPVKQHLITVGTHNEFFHFVNVFFPASIGVWNFSSPAALDSGVANRFERALPTALRPDGPVADFRVRQFGFYAEDRFSPAPNLTLTAGVRMDVPTQPSPTLNPILDTIHFALLGGGTVNTGSFPSGNILWSPRLGFNYNVNGEGQTILRGGVGIFSGRPPYVWLSNAYGNTGLEQASLVCSGATVPTFTVDPNNQPTTCNPASAPSAGRPSVVYFDGNFKFPQAAKLALGIDRELGWGVLGTVDFIYTKSINEFLLEDVNLNGVQGSSAAETGRPLYGTINPGTGAATASRVTGTYADVIRNFNTSGDHSASLAVQFQKRFSNGIEFSASYTYSHTVDFRSMTSDVTSSNYRFGVLNGPVDAPTLATSSFDRPHKVTISGTVNTPFDSHFSLFYTGVSGTPFTYVVNGDINADGFSGNDAVYVPINTADIAMPVAGQAATLDNYINNEPCLRNNRGHILPRNSCRNPWQNFFSARLSKTFSTLHGQSIEFTADMLNVLNFLNSKWGLIKVTGQNEETNLIRLTGYDQINGRGIYALNLPIKNQVTLNRIDSRWVFQLGARYAF
ncbi:MAG TPA: TonB-dependent receptor [Gemmatimonadales bacterium]|nr:TonB-dependent receptor [Gemmatimonadales bacterium]